MFYFLSEIGIYATAHKEFTFYNENYTCFKNSLKISHIIPRHVQGVTEKTFCSLFEKKISSRKEEKIEFFGRGKVEKKKGILYFCVCCYPSITIIISKQKL